MRFSQAACNAANAMVALMSAQKIEIKSPGTVRMYSDSEVRRLLRKAQERGINLDEGSPVEKLTIAELDEMLV